MISNSIQLNKKNILLLLLLSTLLSRAVAWSSTLTNQRTHIPKPTNQLVQKTSDIDAGRAKEMTFRKRTAERQSINVWVGVYIACIRAVIVNKYLRRLCVLYVLLCVAQCYTHAHRTHTLWLGYGYATVGRQARHPIEVTLTHCTKLIKHNASHTFRFFSDIYRFGSSLVSTFALGLPLYFIILFRHIRRRRRRSLINRKISERAQSKRRTYGRFGALVVRQFTISLLNIYLMSTDSLAVNVSNVHCTSMDRQNGKREKERVETERCTGCAVSFFFVCTEYSMPSLEGDNQCGVRNWWKASCDNNCHYYPFKYLFLHSWCVLMPFESWRLHTNTHKLTHMCWMDALARSHCRQLRECKLSEHTSFECFISCCSDTKCLLVLVLSLLVLS